MLQGASPLAGLGMTSETDCMRNFVHGCSALQSTAQVSLRGSACSHLVRAHCFDMLTILLQQSSSISAQNSSWTSWHFSFLCVGPSLPVATIPTKVLYLCRASALLMPSCASHFLPVFTRIPAETILTSEESVNIITSLEWVSLNSSISPLKGRCSLVEWPYRAMLLKGRGTPSHLLRN